MTLRAGSGIPGPALFLLFPTDPYIIHSISWTIELAKEDPLPGSQKQLSLVDNYKFGGTCDTALDVGRRITFSMEVPILKGNLPIEFVNYIPSHIRICILIYRNSGSRMRNKDMTLAFRYARSEYNPPYVRSYLHHLRSLRRPQFNFFQQKASPPFQYPMLLNSINILFSLTLSQVEADCGALAVLVK